MKTITKSRYNRISILFSLIATFLFSFNSKAQLHVNTSNNVGVKTSSPIHALDVNGRIHLTNGVIQTGGSAITSTSDMGLYSLNSSAYMRFVTNSGPFNFYTDGGTTPIGGTPKFTIQSNGDVGIGTTWPSYKLDVNGTTYLNGNVTVIGNGTYSGTWSGSDQMFKTNIDSLQNALTIIRQLKPKSYYFDTVGFKEFNFVSKKQYGFIAQELEQVLPELVKSSVKRADYDAFGNVINPELTFKAINYTELIGILTKALQELDATLMKSKQDQQKVTDSLQNQISQLTSSVNNCCTTAAKTANNTNDVNNNTSTVAVTDVTLNNAQAVVLEQNVPNPFAEQTTINYFLPDNTTRAQMLFYNSEGRLIQSVNLNEKGQGQLNVFAPDLSNGVYTYTLVVDGKIIETKKMVKQ